MKEKAIEFCNKLTKKVDAALDNFDAGVYDHEERKTNNVRMTINGICSNNEVWEVDYQSGIDEVSFSIMRSWWGLDYLRFRISDFSTYFENAVGAYNGKNLILKDVLIKTTNGEFIKDIEFYNLG